MSVEDLIDRLRRIDCTHKTAHLAADLIEAMAEEREAHSMVPQYAADSRPARAVDAARARVDAVVKRLEGT